MSCLVIAHSLRHVVGISDIIIRDVSIVRDGSTGWTDRRHPAGGVSDVSHKIDVRGPPAPGEFICPRHRAKPEMLQLRTPETTSGGQVCAK